MNLTGDDPKKQEPRPALLLCMESDSQRGWSFTIRPVEPESDEEVVERLVSAARQISLSILDGGLTPYEGARKIAALCRAERIHPPEELHTFVYADSEWDDRPEDGNIFAEGVVAAAHDMTRTA